MFIADPNPPLMDEIVVLRMRAGKPVEEPLWVEWHAEYGPIPARLVLAAGWDGKTWELWRGYSVSEVRDGSGVRRFRLDRDADQLTHLPPGSDRTPAYEVSIGLKSGWCTCRGYTLLNDTRRPCKHVAALRHLIETNVLPNEVNDEQGTGGGGEAGPAGVKPDRQAD